MVEVRENVTFGGRLQPGARGFMARALLEQGRGGDFRDLEQIAAWATGIAARLAGEAGSVGSAPGALGE
jgi:menaquinone-dependent protoporphyrinogen oxidase